MFSIACRFVGIVDRADQQDHRVDRLLVQRGEVNAGGAVSDRRHDALDRRMLDVRHSHAFAHARAGLVLPLDHGLGHLFARLGRDLAPVDQGRHQFGDRPVAILCLQLRDRRLETHKLFKLHSLRPALTVTATIH